MNPPAVCPTLWLKMFRRSRLRTAPPSIQADKTLFCFQPVEIIDKPQKLEHLRILFAPLDCAGTQMRPADAVINILNDSPPSYPPTSPRKHPTPITPFRDFLFFDSGEGQTQFRSQPRIILCK